MTDISLKRTNYKRTSLLSIVPVALPGGYNITIDDVISARWHGHAQF